MQTMSFLGMLFLPGTFFAVRRPKSRHLSEGKSANHVQTMFSMSFFKFDPSEGTPMISPWIALYFGLTVAFTGFTFVSWNQYKKRVDKPIATKGRPSKELDIEMGPTGSDWSSRRGL